MTMICSENSPGRRRFTLLEVVLAVAVFMLTVALLVAFSQAVTDGWQRLTAEQGEFAELLALDRTLDRILSGAVPFVWRDEDGQPLPVFQGDPDRLRFAVRHRTVDPHDGSLRFVALSVEDGRLLVRYQSRPFLDWEIRDEPEQTSVIAEAVDSVSFLYADLVDGEVLEWVDEWDVERQDLPLAILVYVRWQDGRLESWLRRPAGSGWHERWGRWQPWTGDGDA